VERLPTVAPNIKERVIIPPLGIRSHLYLIAVIEIGSPDEYIK
tara:strand:+ start:203 stop:331 length:129 start_codon:yes stop_codon:yes gene_type:complete